MSHERYVDCGVCGERYVGDDAIRSYIREFVGAIETRYVCVGCFGKKEEEKRIQRVRDYNKAVAPTGTSQYWKHSIVPDFVFTDGVRFVANTLRCWWLVDLIASYQFQIRSRFRAADSRDFQVWRLRALDDAGYVAEAWADVPNESKRLARTGTLVDCDFPDELLPWNEFWVENGVLYLKRER